MALEKKYKTKTRTHNVAINAQNFNRKSSKLALFSSSCTQNFMYQNQ